METIKVINFIIGIVFFVCYSYQFFYILIPFVKKEKPHKKTELHRYAVLISARNEELVIGNLLDSIAAQDYPSRLVNVFVVADNCTDSTAQIAREHGAAVYERFNKAEVGKGYALEYLIDKILEEYGDVFDAYMVFDADNLLSEDYISRMNETFSDGYGIITSYRNSKNYGDNWISAGYALCFCARQSISTTLASCLGQAALCPERASCLAVRSCSAAAAGRSICWSRISSLPSAIS